MYNDLNKKKITEEMVELQPLRLHFKKAIQYSRVDVGAAYKMTRLRTRYCLHSMRRAFDVLEHTV
jgi:hypothetical protein